MIAADRLQNLGELLLDAVQTYKSRTALVEVSRHRETARLSYQDLRDQVRAVSAAFVARGWVGQRVAIAAGNQHRWLVWAAAALHTGTVLVPLDAKLTPDEIDSLLAHAAPAAVLMDHAIWRKRDTWAVPAAVLLDAPDTARLTDGAVTWQALFDQGAALPPPAVSQAPRDAVATIVYSSGTGGRAKGCQLTHGNYLAQYTALSKVFSIAPDDRYLSILPTNHAIDFLCGFLAPLGCGAQVVQLRTVRPAYLLSTLRRYRITQLAAVPLVISAFDRAVQEKLDALSPFKRKLADGAIALNARLTEDGPNLPLSRRLLAPVHEAFGGQLKAIFCGGAPTPADVVRRLYRLGIPVAVGYGLTEACTVVSVNDLAPFRADTVGAPVPGTQVTIDQPDADGIGEVWVKGDTVFAGYLDDPELTASVMAPDGWLKTGDLGWLDATGHLHLVGRARNLIVTPGGKNIYPEDVEQQLTQVPCEALVVYAANYLWPRRSLDNERLVAVLRPREGQSSDQALAALRAANRTLPVHKRLSSVVLWHEAFPRTASLKIKRGPLGHAVREAVAPDQAVGL